MGKPLKKRYKNKMMTTTITEGVTVIILDDAAKRSSTDFHEHDMHGLKEKEVENKLITDIIMGKKKNA